MAKNIEDQPERLRMLLGLDGSGPQKGDKAGQFLWTALSDLWTYAANRIAEITDTVVEIDAAMRMGFNWELGPFELWDAAGVEQTVNRMKAEGKPVAPTSRSCSPPGTRVGTPTSRKPAGTCIFRSRLRRTQGCSRREGVWSVTSPRSRTVW